MRGATTPHPERMLAMGLLVGFLGAGAWAAPMFPTSYETAALSRWLRSATDLRAEDVVAVSRTSLSAIGRRRSDVSGSVFALVRSEALDPAVFAQEGAASWAVEVEIACDAREIRAAATLGYPLHNLQGVGAVLRPADADWRRPTLGTQLHSVVRAICEPAFKGPLVTLTAATPAAPRSSPTRIAQAGSPPQSNAQAQVLASTSRDHAERARNALAARRHGLDVRVERAQVSGATVYRVLVGGFADDRAAAAFCRDQRSQGDQCFLRGGR